MKNLQLHKRLVCALCLSAFFFSFSFASQGASFKKVDLAEMLDRTYIWAEMTALVVNDEYGDGETLLRFSVDEVFFGDHEGGPMEFVIPGGLTKGGLYQTYPGLPLFTEGETYTLLVSQDWSITPFVHGAQAAARFVNDECVADLDGVEVSGFSKKGMKRQKRKIAHSVRLQNQIKKAEAHGDAERADKLRESFNKKYGDVKSDCLVSKEQLQKQMRQEAKAYKKALKKAKRAQKRKKPGREHKANAVLPVPNGDPSAPAPETAEALPIEDSACMPEPSDK